MAREGQSNLGGCECSAAMLGLERALVSLLVALAQDGQMGWVQGLTLTLTLALALTLPLTLPLTLTLTLTLTPTLTVTLPLTQAHRRSSSSAWPPRHRWVRVRVRLGPRLRLGLETAPKIFMRCLAPSSPMG